MFYGLIMSKELMDGDIQGESPHNPKLLLDGHKLLYHLDRLQAWQAGKRIAPIHIDMGLTKDCNLRCLYCYGKVQKMDRSCLPPEALLRFMRDAAAVGVKSVSFIGDGEPLMNPAVYEAAKVGAAAGLDLGMGTNGLLLDNAELPGFLSRLTYLRFNISAANAKSYQVIHQSGAAGFKQALEKIEACVRLKQQNRLPVTIGLQMVLIPECLDQVVPLAKLGAELGVDYLVIKHCSDSETGELGIPLEKYPDYRPWLEEAERCSQPGYQVLVKWKKIMAAGKKTYDHCLGIPFLLQISGNGDVKPCGFLFPKKGYLMGNIIKQSFSDIFHSDHYWEIVNELATEFDVHSQCGTGCRQDYINGFLWDLVQQRPDHINFL